MKGRIKWFDPRRNYGFIKDGVKPGIDLFFHVADIQKGVVLDCYDLVEYKITDGCKGFTAINIKKIKENQEVAQCLK